MNWYNFFGKAKTPDAIIYCGNSRCLNGGVINDVVPRVVYRMSYRADSQEAYCNAFCTADAAARRGELPEEAVSVSEKISMRKAQQLLATGRIRLQPSPA